MDNPAGVNDVAALIERPLTPDEERAIPGWLDVALDRLTTAVPGLESRMGLPGEDPRHVDDGLVKRTLATMVERKVRNAGGLRQYSVDEYGQTVDTYLSSGRIYVSDEELRDFAFTDAAAAAAAPAFSLHLEL